MSRLLAATLLVGALACAGGSPAPGPATSPAGATEDSSESPAELLALLFLANDRDGDGRITERDEGQGEPLRFAILAGGEWSSVVGQAQLAHLADLLARAAAGIEPLDPARIAASRTEVVRGLVDRSWPALIRRSDRLAGIVPVLRASRVQPADGKLYIYHPESDSQVGRRLGEEAAVLADDSVVLIALPRRLDAGWLERLDRQPGLLYLPEPYLVPGGRFVEMYGWDSYFMARGAQASGQIDVARALLIDLLYQIEHYGKIGNSNRSYHRGRSQPPFLPRLALSLAGELPAAEREALLRRTAAAGERELAEVWQAPPRITKTGLSRYHDEARGVPPEVESKKYEVWRDDPAFFDHQRAVRESGWDMTLRFGERGHLIAPVCLNALLYGYERDMAEIYRLLGQPADAKRHEAAARRRRQRVDRYLWDGAKGLYFDWDVQAGERTGYESMASFYALFVGLASEEQARVVVGNLDRFLAAGGLVVSSRASREAAGAEQLQWDWPYGWAPHQVIAVEGLRRYGYAAEADELASRWLSLVIDVAMGNNGLIVEKYDVVARTGNVPVEYGNQGGDRGGFARYRDAPSCRTAPRARSCLERLELDDLRARALGFGWTNASVALLLDGLSPAASARLARAP
jgi:alpha,alpha-trehalase